MSERSNNLATSPIALQELVSDAEAAPANVRPKERLDVLAYDVGEKHPMRDAA